MSARLVRDKMKDVPWRSEMDAKTWLRPVRGHWEHLQLLTRKGLEEYGEAMTATDTDEAREELADLLEVLMGIAHLSGTTWESIVETADDKRERFGGFTEGLVWDTPGEQ